MEDERVKAARKRVKELRDFYGHLGIYAVTIAALFVVDLLSGSGWWFYWPMLGWGIAVAFHGWDVFFQKAFFGAAWEERKMRELLGEKPKRGSLSDDRPGDYVDEIPVPQDDERQQSSGR